MLKPIALSNATSTVMGILFIVCRIFVSISPNFMFQMGQSWFHTFSLQSTNMMQSFSIGNFIFGLLSAVALTWIVTYTTAVLYNSWSK